MTDRIKILVVSETPSALAEIWKKQGFIVETLDVSQHYAPSLLNRFVNRVLKPVGPTPDYWGVGRLGLALEAVVGRFSPDLILFDEPRYFKPQWLQALRENSHPILFSYFRGDAFIPERASRFYYEGIRHFDCHFTDVAENVASLQHNKAPYVVQLPPELPVMGVKQTPTESEVRRFQAEVGVIGDYLSGPRYRLLERLAREGVRLRILSSVDKLSEIEKRKATSCFTLCLSFADQYPQRALEIAAEGGLLLQEHHPEARDLFRDGIEAVFFAEYRDLKEKITHYLKNRPARDLIAQKGHERLLRPDLSLESRANAILSEYRLKSTRSSARSTSGSAR